jgi:hypothetical protein
MATIRGGDIVAGKLQEMTHGFRQKELLRVGFLESAKYPDGKSVAMVASINEYGAPSRGQPPRPFFRNMIAEHEAGWPEMIMELLKKNHYKADLALAEAGAIIAGQLRQSIIALISPPLAASTVRAKGGVDKPLIDTGVMLGSVDFEVKTGD